MNTLMWNHPHTAKHLAELQSLGIEIIPPIIKQLACGDVGRGAMAEVAAISQHVFQSLGLGSTSVSFQLQSLSQIQQTQL